MAASASTAALRTVKVAFAGETRRFRWSPVYLALSALHAVLAEAFPALAAREWVVQYLDNEADVITVKSDEELEVAAEYFAEIGETLKIAIKVLEEPEQAARHGGGCGWRRGDGCPPWLRWAKFVEGEESEPTRPPWARRFHFGGGAEEGQQESPCWARCRARREAAKAAAAAAEAASNAAAAAAVPAAAAAAAKTTTEEAATATTTKKEEREATTAAPPPTYATVSAAAPAAAAAAASAAAAAPPAAATFVADEEEEDGAQQPPQWAREVQMVQEIFPGLSASHIRALLQRHHGVLQGVVAEILKS